MGPAIPVLRIFDEARARSFYLDALGFKVDWEHRFEPGMPLYCQISRDGIVLHLSEHHGDGSPGARVWIPLDDARALYDEIAAVPFELLHQRPGFETDGPGDPGFAIVDPFHNKLVFGTRS